MQTTWHRFKKGSLDWYQFRSWFSISLIGWTKPEFLQRQSRSSRGLDGLFRAVMTVFLIVLVNRRWTIEMVKCKQERVFCTRALTFEHFYDKLQCLCPLELFWFRSDRHLYCLFKLRKKWFDVTFYLHHRSFGKRYTQLNLCRNIYILSYPYDSNIVQFLCDFYVMKPSYTCTRYYLSNSHRILDVYLHKSFKRAKRGRVYNQASYLYSSSLFWYTMIIPLTWKYEGF